MQFLVKGDTGAGGFLWILHNFKDIYVTELLCKGASEC